MIITIDGPTASGKSTVAQMVAHFLSYDLLSSGLLYRALAYSSIRQQLPMICLTTLTSEEATLLLQDIQYVYSPDSGANIITQGICITHYLKDPLIDQGASLIGTNQQVRQALLTYQRSFAHHRNIVAEGRDCGTTVFPCAHCKFFLTALLEVRAHRWCEDQLNRGCIFSFEESVAEVRERDIRDTTRQVAPLVPAADALIIDSSYLTVKETFDTIIAQVTTRCR
jgi:CMP/dCMP kinase